MIEKRNVNIKYIKNRIIDEGKLFEDGDISKLKVDIKKCRSKIDNDISVLKMITSDLVINKQKLLKLKDIEKIKEQILVNKDNIEDIKKEMNKDLQSVSYSGLFLSVQKGINPFHSKEKLSSKSDQFISPLAIHDLNGIFISSSNIVKNDPKITNNKNLTVLDFIHSKISGEMTIEDKLITDVLRKDKNFVYLAKVNVSPLKKSLINLKEIKDVDYKNNEKLLVMNLLKEYDYSKRLKNFGILMLK